MSSEIYFRAEDPADLTPIWFTSSKVILCKRGGFVKNLRRIRIMMHDLGAQVGARQLEEVLRSAGLGSVRRAAQTPFNLIIEARR